MEIAESFGRRLEDLPLMAGNHDTTVSSPRPWYLWQPPTMRRTRRHAVVTVNGLDRFAFAKIRFNETGSTPRRSYGVDSRDPRGKGRNEKSATCVALFPLHSLMGSPFREFLRGAWKRKERNVRCALSLTFSYGFTVPRVFARRCVDLLMTPRVTSTAPRESAAEMSVAPVNSARRARRR